MSGPTGLLIREIVAFLVFLAWGSGLCLALLATLTLGMTGNAAPFFICLVAIWWIGWPVLKRLRARLKAIEVQRREARRNRSPKALPPASVRQALPPTGEGRDTIDDVYGRLPLHLQELTGQAKIARSDETSPVADEAPSRYAISGTRSARSDAT